MFSQGKFVLCVRRSKRKKKKRTQRDNMEESTWQQFRHGCNILLSSIDDMQNRRFEVNVLGAGNSSAKVNTIYRTTSTSSGLPHWRTQNVLRQWETTCITHWCSPDIHQVKNWKHITFCSNRVIWREKGTYQSLSSSLGFNFWTLKITFDSYCFFLITSLYLITFWPIKQNKICSL